MSVTDVDRIVNDKPEAQDEIVAESHVRKFVADALVRQNLAPMPVSSSSSRPGTMTGRLVTTPPATESFVKHTLVEALYRLRRTTAISTVERVTALLARARTLAVDKDALATVAFVEKAITTVFSKAPSAEAELIELTRPFVNMVRPRPSTLMEFFALSGVSAADLRTLTREEIERRIAVQNENRATEERERQERRDASAKRSSELRGTSRPGPWSI